MEPTSFYKKNKKDSSEIRTYMLARDMIITFLIGGLASFFQFIFTIVTVNKMPKTSFGIFSAVLGLIYLIQIPSVALQTFFAKEVAEDKRYRNRDVVSSTIRDFIIYSLLGTLVVVIISPFIANITEIPSGYLLLVGVIVFASILTPVAKGFLLGLQKINLFNLFTIIEAFLKLLILLIALNFSTDPTWPILAYGLPTLIVGIIMLLIIKKESISTKLPVAIPKINWKFLGVTILTIFLFNSAFSIDVVLLDPDIRAYYSVLAIFGKIVFFASVLVSSVLFSYFVNTKSREQKNRYLFVGVMVNVGVSIALVYVYTFFGGWLTEIMFQKEYIGIVNYIVPLSLGVAFYSLGYVFLQYLLSEGEWKQIILLLGTFLLQVALFSNGNNTLYFAVRNQVLTYAIISILIILFWYYTQRRYIKRIS